MPPSVATPQEPVEEPAQVFGDESSPTETQVEASSDQPPVDVPSPVDVPATVDISRPQVETGPTGERYAISSDGTAVSDESQLDEIDDENERVRLEGLLSSIRSGRAADPAPPSQWGVSESVRTLLGAAVSGAVHDVYTKHKPYTLDASLGAAFDGLSGFLEAFMNRSPMSAASAAVAGAITDLIQFGRGVDSVTSAVDRQWAIPRAAQVDAGLRYDARMQEMMMRRDNERRILTQICRDREALTDYGVLVMSAVGPDVPAEDASRFVEFIRSDGLSMVDRRRLYEIARAGPAEVISEDNREFLNTVFGGDGALSEGDEYGAQQMMLRFKGVIGKLPEFELGSLTVPTENLKAYRERLREHLAGVEDLLIADSRGYARVRDESEEGGYRRVSPPGLDPLDRRLLSDEAVLYRRFLQTLDANMSKDPRYVRGAQKHEKQIASRTAAESEEERTNKSRFAESSRGYQWLCGDHETVAPHLTRFSHDEAEFMAPDPRFRFDERAFSNAIGEMRMRGPSYTDSQEYISLMNAHDCVSAVRDFVELTGALITRGVSKDVRAVEERKLRTALMTALTAHPWEGDDLPPYTPYSGLVPDKRAYLDSFGKNPKKESPRNTSGNKKTDGGREDRPRITLVGDGILPDATAETRVAVEYDGSDLPVFMIAKEDGTRVPVPPDMLGYVTYAHGDTMYSPGRSLLPAVAATCGVRSEFDRLIGMDWKTMSAEDRWRLCVHSNMYAAECARRQADGVLGKMAQMGFDQDELTVAESILKDWVFFSLGVIPDLDQLSDEEVLDGDVTPEDFGVHTAEYLEAYDYLGVGTDGDDEECATSRKMLGQRQMEFIRTSGLIPAVRYGIKSNDMGFLYGYLRKMAGDLEDMGPDDPDRPGLERRIDNFTQLYRSVCDGSYFEMEPLYNVFRSNRGNEYKRNKDRDKHWDDFVSDLRWRCLVADQLKENIPNTLSDMVRSTLTGALGSAVRNEGGLYTGFLDYLYAQYPEFAVQDQGGERLSAEDMANAILSGSVIPMHLRSTDDSDDETEEVPEIQSEDVHPDESEDDDGGDEEEEEDDAGDGDGDGDGPDPPHSGGNNLDHLPGSLSKKDYTEMVMREVFTKSNAAFRRTVMGSVIPHLVELLSRINAGRTDKRELWGLHVKKGGTHGIVFLGALLPKGSGDLSSRKAKGVTFQDAGVASGYLEELRSNRKGDEANMLEHYLRVLNVLNSSNNLNYNPVQKLNAAAKLIQDEDAISNLYGGVSFTEEELEDQYRSLFANTCHKEFAVETRARQFGDVGVLTGRSDDEWTAYQNVIEKYVKPLESKKIPLGSGEWRYSLGYGDEAATNLVDINAVYSANGIAARKRGKKVDRFITDGPLVQLGNRNTYVISFKGTNSGVKNGVSVSFGLKNRVTERYTGGKSRLLNSAIAGFHRSVVGPKGGLRFDDDLLRNFKPDAVNSNKARDFAYVHMRQTLGKRYVMTPVPLRGGEVDWSYLKLFLDGKQLAAPQLLSAPFVLAIRNATFGRSGESNDYVEALRDLGYDVKYDPETGCVKKIVMPVDANNESYLPGLRAIKTKMNANKEAWKAYVGNGYTVPLDDLYNPGWKLEVAAMSSMNGDQCGKALSGFLGSTVVLDADTSAKITRVFSDVNTAAEGVGVNVALENLSRTAGDKLMDERWANIQRHLALFGNDTKNTHTLELRRAFDRECAVCGFTTDADGVRHPLTSFGLGFNESGQSVVNSLEPCLKFRKAVRMCKERMDQIDADIRNLDVYVAGLKTYVDFVNITCANAMDWLNADYSKLPLDRAELDRINAFKKENLARFNSPAPVVPAVPAAPANPASPGTQAPPSPATPETSGDDGDDDSRGEPLKEEKIPSRVRFSVTGEVGRIDNNGKVVGRPVTQVPADKVAEYRDSGKLYKKAFEDNKASARPPAEPGVNFWRKSALAMCRNFETLGSRPSDDDLVMTLGRVLFSDADLEVMGGLAPGTLSKGGDHRAGVEAYRDACRTNKSFRDSLESAIKHRRLGNILNAPDSDVGLLSYRAKAVCPVLDGAYRTITGNKSTRGSFETVFVGTVIKDLAKDLTGVQNKTAGAWLKSIVEDLGETQLYGELSGLIEAVGDGEIGVRDRILQSYGGDEKNLRRGVLTLCSSLGRYVLGRGMYLVDGYEEKSDSPHPLPLISERFDLPKVVPAIDVSDTHRSLYDAYKEGNEGMHILAPKHIGWLWAEDDSKLSKKDVERRNNYASPSTRGVTGMSLMSDEMVIGASVLWALALQKSDSVEVDRAMKELAGMAFKTSLNTMFGMYGGSGFTNLGVNNGNMALNQVVSEVGTRCLIDDAYARCVAQSGGDPSRFFELMNGELEVIRHCSGKHRLCFTGLGKDERTELGKIAWRYAQDPGTGRADLEAFIRRQMGQNRFGFWNGRAFVVEKDDELKLTMVTPMSGDNEVLDVHSGGVCAEVLANAYENLHLRGFIESYANGAMAGAPVNDDDSTHNAMTLKVEKGVIRFGIRGGGEKSIDLQELLNKNDGDVCMVVDTHPENYSHVKSSGKVVTSVSTIELGDQEDENGDSRMYLVVAPVPADLVSDKEHPDLTPLYRNATHWAAVEEADAYMKGHRSGFGRAVEIPKPVTPSAAVVNKHLLNCVGVYRLTRRGEGWVVGPREAGSALARDGVSLVFYTSDADDGTPAVRCSTYGGVTRQNVALHGMPGLSHTSYHGGNTKGVSVKAKIGDVELDGAELGVMYVRDPEAEPESEDWSLEYNGGA